MAGMRTPDLGHYATEPVPLLITLVKTQGCVILWVKQEVSDAVKLVIKVKISTVIVFVQHPYYKVAVKQITVMSGKRKRMRIRRLRL